MKAWHKVTHWSWRSSKSSKSKTQPSEEPAQAEETPVQVARNTRTLLVHGHEKESNNFSRFGQTPAYGNHEEEKTTVDPSYCAYGAKEFVSEEECRGEECPNVRLPRKKESLRTGDQEEIQKLRATLLQQKDDLQRNEKMAVAKLKAVEDEKDALEVALGAERANMVTQQKTMYTLGGKNVEAQSVDMELRNQVETLKKKKSQAEKEHRATLLQLKDDLQRNEKMAVAKLKAVEDEKDALEVALGAERAKTAMQQDKMSQAENEEKMSQAEDEVRTTSLQLKDELQRNEKMAVAKLKAVEDEKAALEVALGAERANTAMQQEKMSQDENDEVRATSLQLKDELQRNESELCATLLQLKDDLDRNEKMAVARLQAVEDKKAALEVALGAERAKTAMQQEKMSQDENDEVRATSLQLKDDLDRNEKMAVARLQAVEDKKAALEVALGAERAKTAMQQEKMSQDENDELKDDLQRNEKMAVARLQAVEDKKAALEVALGAERANTAMQQEKMSQAENDEVRAASLQLKDELQRNESELCATLLQLKDDLQRNEKMAVARLQAVEDKKAALEVALGAERANTAMQQEKMSQAENDEVRATSLQLKDELQRNESELCATLLQLKDDLQRNEKMAVARLQAVQDEKAALEVALGAERANTAMQQEKMSQAENDEVRATSLQLKDELQRNESELCATLLQLKDDLERNEKMAVAKLKAVADEKDALEVALGAERANTAMQQKTMYTLREESIEAQSVEVELRDQVEMLKEKMSQEAEIGRRQAKEEKIRSGVARLIEKDLRKQVATLEQSRMQQADEIGRLLTQVFQQNEEPHIGSVATFGRGKGSNATASALGDDHPDCPRLHADFYPGWEAPVGVAIVGIFRITVCTSLDENM
ncbi:unnamed protein product [Ectocarpus sp. CCAP 1310/34]|nr:unnamed protein product [Ectocarpus sp. CCAP 1310/34]